MNHLRQIVCILCIFVPTAFDHNIVAAQTKNGFAPETEQASAKPGKSVANPADVATVDAIIAAVYDVISGPAGKKRDWDRMRSLFIPEAKMLAVTHRTPGKALRVLDVNGYISAAGKYFETNSFFERESARRLEMFGQIAHAFSTYESRHNETDARPFERGINSIQLVNDGKRWWIVTIMWDSEQPDNPLPEKYLNSCYAEKWRMLNLTDG